jgi:hypothetical protein
MAYISLTGGLFFLRQGAQTGRSAPGAEWADGHGPGRNFTRRRIVALDPALKGYVALQAWRVSNWLWRQSRRDVALLLQSESSDSLQVSIHPSASIGTSVFLDHATGIVIGAFVTIGDEVTILQNVTIGRMAEAPDRAPRIGRGVYLGGGANDSRRHQHRRLCQGRVRGRW